MYKGKNCNPYVIDRGLTAEHVKLGRDLFNREDAPYHPYAYPHSLTSGHPTLSKRTFTSGSVSTESANDQGTESHCGTGLGLTLVPPVFLREDVWSAGSEKK